MVRQRGTSWQVDFAYRGSRYRKSFASKDDADLWENDARGKLMRGEAVENGEGPAAGTLQDLMNRTRERFWKGSKAEEHAVNNAQTVVDILGPNRPPASVGTSQIESVIAELRRRNLSDATINRKLAALSKMLRYGHALGVVKAVPYIGRLKESQGRLRWLTEAEEQIVLDQANFLGRTDLKDLIIILLDTGARLGEIAGNVKTTPLAWKDVDLNAPAIRLWQTKNGGSRSIPLTDRAVEVLRLRRQACPDAEAVFWNLDHWTAQHQWAHLRTSLKMDHDPQFVLHMLRHTFCSRLVQRGVSIQVVQQLAGHKTLAVTLRYAHLHQVNLVEAIRGQNPVQSPDCHSVTPVSQ